MHVREQTDVLIIGGGIVGAATAYHLARQGVPVILVEAETFAYGATGRNLGFTRLVARRNPADDRPDLLGPR